MQHSQYGMRMHDQENIDGLGAACNGQAGQRRCVCMALLNRRPRPIVAGQGRGYSSWFEDGGCIQTIICTCIVYLRHHGCYAGEHGVVGATQMR